MQLATACRGQANFYDPNGGVSVLTGAAQTVALPCFGLTGFALEVPPNDGTRVTVKAYTSTDKTLGAPISTRCVPTIGAGGTEPCGTPRFIVVLSASAPVHFRSMGTHADLVVTNGGFSAGNRYALQLYAQESGKIIETLVDAYPSLATPTKLSLPLVVPGGLPNAPIVAVVYEQIAPAGQITLYPMLTKKAGVEAMTVGPDGALWFAENASNRIGRITTSGAIREFAVPTPKAGPFGIAPGPDGSIWFTEANVAKIGRITLGGTFRSELSIPAPGYKPYYMVAGSDHSLWFTLSDGQGDEKVGRFSSAFHIYPLNHVNSGGFGSCCGTLEVAADPTGVWFTFPAQLAIGHISNAGSFSWIDLVNQTPDDSDTLQGQIAYDANTGGPCWAYLNTYQQQGGDVPYSYYENAETEFPDPAYFYGGVGDMAVSRDGAAWWVSYGDQWATRVSIDRVQSVNGTLTFAGGYNLPDLPSDARALTAGPDGAIFYFDNADYIGRIATGLEEGPS